MAKPPMYIKYIEKEYHIEVLKKLNSAINQMTVITVDVAPKEKNMKKVIICNIPMKKDVDQTVYVSEDKSLPVTDRPVRYSINAFLEKTLKADDEVKVLMLAKKDEYSCYEQNVQYFIDELNNANFIGAKIEFKTIDTAFSQERSVHEQLMSRIVDEVEPETHVLADITYGSKDMAIVVFTALGFAGKIFGLRHRQYCLWSS